MEEKLEQVASQVADISKQLSGFEARFSTAMTDLKQQARTNVEDLKQQTRINVEDLKREVRLLGDGYVATLEGVERELAELNRKVDTRFSDHDRVLANHSTGITKLEQR